MATDILPDSRLKSNKGAKPSKILGWWVPVFCAICGIPYGYVPEENCSFACWLCNECSENYGEIFGMMMMPDEMYWEKVKEAQIEKYGKELNQQEINQEVASQSSLGRLIEQGK